MTKGKIMLRLNKSDYDKIIAHAKENLPEEACGLIAGSRDGDTKEIKKVYLLTNIDHTNEHFSMDPKEQLAAVKDMRANGLTPLGNWHSHPESPARPSEEDKRLAYDPTVNYLILSLMNIDEPVLKAFDINKEREVTVEEIEIV
jgi:proteasome lid subunit RPN8/RPN11